jgi:hypothetical protein
LSLKLSCLYIVTLCDSVRFVSLRYAVIIISLLSIMLRDWLKCHAFTLGQPGNSDKEIVMNTFNYRLSFKRIKLMKKIVELMTAIICMFSTAVTFWILFNNA